MPGRFPLTPVPLFNDPFCEDGFCNDTDGVDVDVENVSPIYDYCEFGNIPIRVFWTRNLYRKIVACNTGETIIDVASTASGSENRTTCTVWLATRDLEYPLAVPDSQSFPPFGYFSPNLTWNIPCATPPVFIMSRNGVMLTKGFGTNTTAASALYGSNVDYFTTTSAILSQTLTITKIELRGNVTGLGVIGDDITAQGLIALPLNAGGLPAQQTFNGFANATP